MTRCVDVLIAGQGLAGSLLAYSCKRYGLSVLVVDDDALPAASQVAAGLITPITGQRAVLSWNVATLAAFAQTTYTELALTLATDSCLNHLPELWQAHHAWRFFASEAQAEVWNQRLHRDHTLANYTANAQPIAPHWPFIGYACAPLYQNARLDQALLIRHVRHWLHINNALRCDRIEPGAIACTKEPAANVRWSDVQARWLVVCQGAACARWPQWHELHHRPARGDLLTIAIDGDVPAIIVHGEIFMAPQNDATWRVGATYDWTRDQAIACPHGRAQLEASLQRLLSRPYTVLRHDAGVRPIIGDRVPVIGPHPDLPALVLFSGLASKGALWAPYFADQLAQHLANGSALDSNVDVRHRLTKARERSSRRDTSPKDVRKLLR